MKTSTTAAYPGRLPFHRLEIVPDDPPDLVSVHLVELARPAVGAPEPERILRAAVGDELGAPPFRVAGQAAFAALHANRYERDVLGVHGRSLGPRRCLPEATISASPDVVRGRRRDPDSLRLLAYPSQNRPGMADDGAVGKFERR